MTDPNQTMKHELAHTDQINTDPQGTLNTQADHQNDINPEETNPLEISANDFMNTPDQQDTMTFDEAVVDIGILLDVPVFGSFPVSSDLTDENPQ
jgi:hypothetical protein